MLSEDTYWAKVFLGLRVGYSRKHYSYRSAENTIKRYVSDHPLCVSITRTQFAYKGGWDRGIIIELINYPRFPIPFGSIREYATDLAQFLMLRYGQNRISIMMPDVTIMLEVERC